MDIFNKIFSSDYKSIYRSIEQGNLPNIREYLNSDKDIDSDFEIQSILHYAINNCENNYVDTIKLLIESDNVNINSHKSKFSETPLHRLCARANPYINLVELLLKKGADVNAVNISGKTPIFYCSFNYSCELLNLLVKFGADVNAKDKYGNTLLHDDYIDCLDETFEEFLKLLLKFNFDINSINNANFTPLDLCRNKKIENILVKYGAVYS
ncbi:hypothetical protein D4Z93_06600 [Clostridium fermenticellae]|uniref:Uncharacterized protein n=1 Tax=Clostridium fermenticellae TaxID=2068654 RepID=A0A386H3Z4_9CLOT|nr:ankyrin repeat domain-containing protein [Clostridium fermenticellae]AYD40205.1 hypothetical protein D4Z93_06600 [Clostridium fermenticellae]